MTLFLRIKEHSLWNEPRTAAGIGLIVLSYIAGWPAVSALGVISLWVDKPDLVLVGGPAVYIFSYLIFLAGIALAGKKCAKMLMARAKGCLKQTLQFDFR